MEKAHVNVQRIYSAQKPIGVKNIRINWCRKESGPVLNIETATIMDVPGIEVQVPSLSSPGHAVQILISRGLERFVKEIHRHNSDIVNNSSS